MRYAVAMLFLMWATGVHASVSLYCMGTVYWLNKYRPMASWVTIDLSNSSIGFNGRYWAFFSAGGRADGGSILAFHRDTAPFTIDGTLNMETGQFDAQIIYANNYTEEWLGRCR